MSNDSEVFMFSEIGSQSFALTETVTRQQTFWCLQGGIQLSRSYLEGRSIKMWTYANRSETGEGGEVGLCQCKRLHIYSFNWAPTQWTT